MVPIARGLTLTLKEVFLERKELAYTEKKENKIFVVYKEIQSGGVAKSNMSKGGRTS
jgi:hypothetical protein